VIAEFFGGYSVSYDFVDHYRGADRKYDYMWEERWVRDEGYSKIIPEAVTGLFKKLSIGMQDVDTLIFPCFFKTEHRNIAKKLGATPEKVIDNLHEVCGETGAAHPLVMFAYALDKAKPGDRILVAGFGQGCDALYFRVTENLSKAAQAKRNQRVFGKQANYRQLPQVPQVQRPDPDGNGHSGRSAHADGHDGALAAKGI
jgi:3-hydroxy-3-methylglutaryl CoA synthase